MSDSTTHQYDSFGDQLCNAICATVLTDGEVITERVRDAAGDVLDEEFDRRVGGLATALEHVKDSPYGSADAQFSLEQDLQAARDAEGDLFTAGYSRIDRALDARGETLRLVTAEYTPDTFTCRVPAPRFDVESGDTVWAVLSVTPTDEGLASELYPMFLSEPSPTCGCPDKHHNTAFPVCKHELVFLLQVAAHIDETTVDTDDRPPLAVVFTHARQWLTSPSTTADGETPPLATHSH